jgi:serine phosphatase RsbU (regulator of sigma subunit)
MQLAELTAELLQAKSAYGDHIVNASRTQELTLAAEIRWSTIPPLTFLSPDVSIAAFLEPAYDIAGDAFDYAINGNTAHIAIIDAVGHGMEASRIANLALLAHRHCRRRGGGMVESYTAMDEAIEAAFDRSAYATAQLATLDLPSGVLRWLSAGHPAPLLVRSGEPVRKLVGQSFLPAGIADGDPVIHEEELRPGDVVAFYSDGITEARSATDDVYGAERLGRLLRETIEAGHPPPEIVRQVLHTALEHQGGETVDDATLMLVGWRF